MTADWKGEELYAELRAAAHQVMPEDLTVDDITAMLLIFYRVIARKALPQPVGGRPRLAVVPPALETSNGGTKQ